MIQASKLRASDPNSYASHKSADDWAARRPTPNCKCTTHLPHQTREVVLKHRELVRTALRDEETVAKLDTQLQTLLLEKARQTDPWELISTPTLLDKPVAPRKRRILALGLLAGIVAGSGARSDCGSTPRALCSVSKNLKS